MTDGLSLMDYVSVLRRRWVLIVASAVLLALVGFGWSVRQTSQYQGKAEVLVDFSSSAQYVQPSGGSSQVINATDRARALQNEIRFAKSQVVVGPLEQKLGHKPQLAASGQTASADVLTFAAKSTSPVVAAAEANTYAQAYLAARSQRVVSSFGDAAKAIDDLLAGLHSRFDALGAPPSTGNDPNATQRQALDSQIKYYDSQKTALDVAAKVGQGTGATIITLADAPTSPVSPKPVRTAALGFAVGLVLGVGLVFLREFADDTVRTSDDLERTAQGITLLGAIPKDRAHAAARPASSQNTTGRLDEAFRSLRTSVQFVGLHKALRALQVTSANPAEGKTTVATHLAAALAYGGDHVALIDGDLRNPSLHTRFGLPNGVGLSTVMLGQVDLRSALRQIEDLPGLFVLPAGPLPGNPADFLWPAAAPLAVGATLPDIIGQLVRGGYRVVVDSPPVLPVADAMTISRMVDGTIVVVSAGSTGARSLRQTLQQLGQADAQVVGLAFNSVTESAGYGGRYGYGYGYSASPTGPLGRLRSGFRRAGRRGAPVRPISTETVWEGRQTAGSAAAPEIVGPTAPVTSADWRPGSQPPGQWPRPSAGLPHAGSPGGQPVPSGADPHQSSRSAVPPLRNIDLTDLDTAAPGGFGGDNPVRGASPSGLRRPARPDHPDQSDQESEGGSLTGPVWTQAPGALRPHVNGVNGAGPVAPNGSNGNGALGTNGGRSDHELLEEALRRHLAVDQPADPGRSRRPHS